MKTFLPFLAILLFFAACNKNNDDKPAGAWSNSVFIVNEGPFSTGTGTISAFDRETLEVDNAIFSAANSRPLGNIVQSMHVYKDKAYIVVNKANKIEVVNLGDFTSVATIENLVLPRYFIPLNDQKAYVSCWDSTIKVIDISNFSIVKSIHTGTGPDEMVISDDKLFVINGGGFSVDSTLAVISTSGDNLVQSVVVGQRPADICLDRDGNVWVLCSGKGWNGFPSADDSPAELVCLDPATLQIIKEITFPDTENHPDQLIINREGNTLYYNHPQGIFALDISASGLDPQPFVASTTMYYALGYDEAINAIYASDPLNYDQNGWIYRFRAQDGDQIDAFLAGVIPTGFWFNY